MDRLTEDKVRGITAEQLDLPRTGLASAELGDLPTEEPDTEQEDLDADNPVLNDVLDALDMGFAGAILVGPPGTGKSYHAKRIASYISGGHTGAVRFVQFHASYQYEDFMEGHVPTSSGGFELKPRTFRLLCQEAAKTREITHVLVVDEISRCDAARVFGEALTYIETDKRNEPFTLASGSLMEIPKNLVILATMNPWDKGVDEVDIALSVASPTSTCRRTPRSSGAFSTKRASIPP